MDLKKDTSFIWNPIANTLRRKEGLHDDIRKIKDLSL